MGGLNRFLTRKLLEIRNQQQSNFLDDVILTQEGLRTITTYTDDAFMLQYLFARALRTGDFKVPTRGSRVTDLDVQRIAPLVGVLSVPDIYQYQDRQIEESIGYFQSKSLRAKPGVVSPNSLNVFELLFDQF